MWVKRRAAAAGRAGASPVEGLTGPIRASISAARAAMVGASNRVEIGRSTRNARRNCAKSRTAMSEWPPGSKKLSSIPTRPVPSRSCQ
jgi:hypothetical protein